MKNKDLQTALEDLAVVMTMHQRECPEFAFVAYSLWKLSQGRIKVGKSNAKQAKDLCYFNHNYK